ncbi:MAG: AI-2E family transporter [Armatimonadetes bacterium]|nr:AI-2E family transporter [Armatimonadota bacterium]
MQSRSALANGVLIALAVIGILLGLWVLSKLSAIVILALIALILSSGIDPVVQSIHNAKLPPRGWQIPRAFAILIVLLGALLLFAGIFIFITSVAWSQGLLLWERMPIYMASLQGYFEELRRIYPQIPPLSQLTVQARQQLGQVGSYVFQTAAAVFGILGAFFSTFTVLVLTFYMTLEKRDIRSFFLSLISIRQRDEVSAALAEAGEKMGGWLRGQLTLAMIVTAVISIAMLLLGIPYAMLLGLIGGVAELIPMLGPFAAGAIAIPVAYATQPTWVFIATLVFFIVLSQVEGNWLAPRIMQSSVGLSPLTSILVLLSGAALLGVVGALISVPLAAGFRVFLIRLVVPAIRRAQQESTLQTHSNLAPAPVAPPTPEPAPVEAPPANTSSENAGEPAGNP